VAPNKGGCSPPDGSYLIFTKKEGTVCNATDQIFVLDQDGVIYHKCSKKVVCPQDNNPTNWKKLMLKDKCDLSISRHVRLPTHNNLKNLKNDFCVHPNGGWPGEGVHLLYWPGCGEERLKLNFFELESGIRSYGEFCVAPNKGGCSPLDGSFLIFTKREGTACNATDQIFLLDQDGVIYHKCSKKEVCPHAASTA
ncbi:uncharacterized protein LOC113677061, partial [Pocillopora damicornis]|uniref:uncharacterized protein LOC113677061 n=1 Tax=Pocillopora damicornis TaxID=46731 RepID=UPI000F550316